MRLKPILWSLALAVAASGGAGGYVFYKHVELLRDIRTRLADIQSTMPATAASVTTTSAPLDAQQLAAIAEMARQARDEALAARLAANQARDAAAAAIEALKERTGTAP